MSLPKTSTKYESHLGILPAKARCEKLIEDALFMSRPKSREELAIETGLRLSTVCGRVKPMLEAKRLVVAGRIWNVASRRNVETLALS